MLGMLKVNCLASSRTTFTKNLNTQPSGRFYKHQNDNITAAAATPIYSSPEKFQALNVQNFNDNPEGQVLLYPSYS